VKTSATSAFFWYIVSISLSMLINQRPYKLLGVGKCLQRGNYKNVLVCEVWQITGLNLIFSPSDFMHAFERFCLAWKWCWNSWQLSRCFHCLHVTQTSHFSSRFRVPGAWRCCTGTNQTSTVFSDIWFLFSSRSPENVVQEGWVLWKKNAILLPNIWSFSMNA
jgi:hypothetical protein